MDARKGLAWRLTNANTSDLCLGAVEEAVSPNASLEIFNIDRRSRFTSHALLSVVKNHGNRISMKNQVMLENYYLPDHLKTRIDKIIDRNNRESYHENLNTVAPEDVYYGRRRTILNQRRRIIQRTLAKLHRLIYKLKTAS